MGVSKLISVVIPTHNRAEMVVRCVKSVLEADYPEKEIVVVDDASTDDTLEKLRAAFALETRVKILESERNSGPSVNRNRGALSTGGKYILFLDDDNIIEKNALAELVSVFESDDKIGFVAPISINHREGKDNLVWTLGSVFNPWTSMPADPIHDIPLSELPETPTLYPTKCAPNAFMVARQAFEAVDGFDESYSITYEESDFGYRIVEKGCSAFFTTQARVHHYGTLEQGCSSALRMLGIEKPGRTYHFARNRLRFARRHFPFLPRLSVYFIFAPLSAVYYGFVAIRNRRPDIALAYLKGTLFGYFDRLKLSTSVVK